MDHGVLDVNHDGVVDSNHDAIWEGLIGVQHGADPFLSHDLASPQDLGLTSVPLPNPFQ